MSLKYMHNYENRRLEIMKRKLIDSLPFERQVASAIDILRCVAWFEHIRDHLQKTGSRVCATAYGIGKFIQPETYAGVSPALYNHNMWPKYAAGLHCPGQVTLAAAEKKVPGSTAIYDASVWTMLNVTNPAHAARGGAGSPVRKKGVEVRQVSPTQGRSSHVIQSRAPCWRTGCARRSGSSIERSLRSG